MGLGRWMAQKGRALAVQDWQPELGPFEPKGKGRHGGMCNASILLARWEAETGDSPRSSWTR